MKTVTALSLAAIGLVGSAHAFSLDFSSFANGTELNNNIVVNVPGYGNVRFSEATPATEAEISNQFFGLPGIKFTDGESVVVTFEGAPAVEVSFAFVGVGNSESFTTTSIDPSTPDAGTHNISFAGDGAALFAVEFESVPEPSSTLLVALSALGLIGRRRR